MHIQRKSAFNLDALRINPTASAIFWSVLTAALLTGLWIFVGVSLSHERRLALEAGTAGTARLAVDYAEKTQRALHYLDQVLLTVQLDFDLHGNTVPLENLVLRGLIPESRDFLVMLADESGKIQASDRTPVPAQPGYAQTRPNPFGAADYAAEPVRVEKSAYEPFLNNYAVRVSRALVDAHGAYAGALIGALPAFKFLQLIDAEKIEASGFVSVLAGNGQVVAHYGRVALAAAPLDEGELAHGTGARWVASASADPAPYYVEWKHVTGTSLLVAVGRSEAGILGPFATRRDLHLRAGYATSVLILLFGIAAAWLSARLAVRYRQELATRTAYRIASEAALDGFFILEAVRHPDGAVRAFTIKDCNRRAAELMGRERSELLGHDLSHIMPAAQAAQTTAYYARIFSNGRPSRLSEFVPRSGSPLKPAWVAHQATPTENGVAVTFRDISASKTHARTLEDMARIDALTGLPNRRWLMENLSATIDACAAKNARMALLFIDLDDFKTVNDTLGHAAGDQLLEAVARRVRGAVRDKDVLCRLGGDEFTVVLGTIESAQEAAAISERVLATLHRPFNLEGHETQVGSSIGISIYPENGLDTDTLIKHADLAMYRAKELGKGGFQFFENELSADVEHKLALEQDLRLAIEQREFVLAYQPKYSAGAGRVIGLEALVRWDSPARGRVLPGEFIALAEKTGLICAIGKLVFDMACRQIAQWRQQGYAPLPVSINVSPCQLVRTDLAADVAAALARHDVPGTLIEVEVTEACVMEQPGLAREKLAPLRALGVRIALGDFGSGYSSLDQLKILDVAVLKIARSHIADLPDTAGTQAFLGAVAALGAALGIDIIAEGVETPAQLAYLQSAGCDHVQGFLFSKAVEADEVQAAVQSLEQGSAAAT
ncbi:MAG: EAL domain-containing protein [Burkholderiales bacterium]|nr:EAL domain-containing protein [Burkholderiales bacterium]